MIQVIDTDTANYHKSVVLNRIPGQVQHYFFTLSQFQLEKIQQFQVFCLDDFKIDGGMNWFVDCHRVTFLRFHGHRIWIFFFFYVLSLQVGLCFNWRWWARSWWIGRLFSWISLGNFETLHCITQLIHCTADLPIPIAFLVGRPLQWVKQRHIILNEPNALKSIDTARKNEHDA